MQQIFHFRFHFRTVNKTDLYKFEPFSQDYDLAFHTTYAVCVHFIHQGRDIQFKVQTTDFLETFRGNFTYYSYQNFFQKSAESRLG